MVRKGRIAIFQADWPLQTHTVNLVASLARAGYEVELFLYRTILFCELDSTQTMPGVVVHLLSPADFGEHNIWGGRSDGVSRRHIDKLLYALMRVTNAIRIRRPWRWVAEHYLFWRKEVTGLIPQRVVANTEKLMIAKKYCCTIGVEKKGLVWAGIMAEKRKVPYIYYSLELYTRDHPAAVASIHARRLKLMEAHYHRAAFGTVIQDCRRAQVLFADNAIASQEIAYLPVSLPGPVRQRSLSLQKKYGIDWNKLLILQTGLITKGRFSYELVTLAQGFPKEWMLVLHGWGPRPCIRQIRARNNLGRAALSFKRMSVVELEELVSSAHIGLVLYEAVPLNDRLTAFASEKLAMYLKCGLPVVAFNYLGYEVITKERCGVLIDTLDDLPGAIRTIQLSYQEFSENAHRTFLRHYEFGKNFRAVLALLDRLGPAVTN